MMLRRSPLVALAVTLSCAPAGAAPLPVQSGAALPVQSGAPLPAPSASSLPGRPSEGEAPFVAAVSADLAARFPTTAAAERAGYLRYTDEDATGAVSYANRRWTSVDARHPSQLWYDVDGRLLGADFSVPYEAQRPERFGVDPQRWERFGFHVHYGLAGRGGTTVYGATGRTKFAAAGLAAEHPTADDLVKLGIAKQASDVRFVFVFPAIWDLAVWVLPNPAGAFAEKNPSVTPRHPAKDSG